MPCLQTLAEFWFWGQSIWGTTLPYAEPMQSKLEGKAGVHMYSQAPSIVLGTATRRESEKAGGVLAGYGALPVKVCHLVASINSACISEHQPSPEHQVKNISGEMCLNQTYNFIYYAISYPKIKSQKVLFFLPPPLPPLSTLEKFTQ